LNHIEVFEPGIELIDQGLDSMRDTQLIFQLETSLKIALGPEILFEYSPLLDQFVDEGFALACLVN